MILTVDIGNTNIKLALWKDNKIVSFKMMDSKLIDFKSFILSFLYKANVRENQIEDCVMASVVPSLTDNIKNALKNITGKEPHIINANNYYGIKVDKEIHEEVGADLLVMCAYAYQKIKKELLVVSFGTATVICHVSKDGTFKHCVLAPGFLTLASTLYNNAEKLPEFDPKKEKTYLVNNTMAAMNVGVIDGYIGMIKYLLTCLKCELKTNPIIVGCGGNGKDIVAHIKEIQSYDADMVTLGLHFIYQKYLKNV